MGMNVIPPVAAPLALLEKLLCTIHSKNPHSLSVPHLQNCLPLFSFSLVTVREMAKAPQPQLGGIVVGAVDAGDAG